METSFRLLRQNCATFLTCVWRIRKIEQEFHDFVCVPPLTVGQEECLGPGFLNIVENLWQSIVQLDVLCQVLDCHRLEITLDVYMIHCPSHVLEQGFVRKHYRAIYALESIPCSKHITIILTARLNISKATLHGRNLLFVFRVVKEEVHNTGEKINFRKIKQGVVDIDPTVIELYKLVWVFE